MVYQNRLWNHYRSEGERRIGEYLSEQGIDFTYERPVAVIDNAMVRLWYPDFHLNDYHILIEYLGMNGNSKNDKVNDYKRRVYQENKLDLIEMHPSDFKGNWQVKISEGIYKTLEGRIRNYVSRTRYHPSSAHFDKNNTQLSFGFYPKKSYKR